MANAQSQPTGSLSAVVVKRAPMPPEETPKKSE